MTFDPTIIDRRHPRGFIRIPDVRLSKAQDRAIVLYVDSALPQNVSEQMQISLRKLGLIKPTGPRHRSHHLTGAGVRVAMRILARQHVDDDLVKVEVA